MKRSRSRSLAALALLGVLAGCSTFTSIEAEDDGRFVLTGWKQGKGFLWICRYDPATYTLTVEEER